VRERDGDGDPNQAKREKSRYSNDLNQCRAPFQAPGQGIHAPREILAKGLGLMPGSARSSHNGYANNVAWIIGKCFLDWGELREGGLRLRGLASIGWNPRIRADNLCDYASQTIQLQALT
jgi:hypothetical protein